MNYSRPSDRIRIQKELEDERALLTSLTIMLQRMSTHSTKADLMRLYNEWIDPVEKWVKCLESEIQENEHESEMTSRENENSYARTGSDLYTYCISASSAPKTL